MDIIPGKGEFLGGSPVGYKHETRLGGTGRLWVRGIGSVTLVGGEAKNEAGYIFSLFNTAVIVIFSYCLFPTQLCVFF